MSDHAVVTRRASGATRFLRGWTVAIIAVLLAAGGHQAAHTLMHGMAEPIPPALFAFAVALTAPVAVGLAGKRHAMWATALTTLLGQLIFHGLYSLPSAGMHQAHTAHHGHEQHAAGADTLMIAAHLVAAALTMIVVIHGERSLLTIVDWAQLKPVRLMLAARTAPTIGPSPLPPIGWVWIPHPMNWARTTSTRGPPVLA